MPPKAFTTPPTNSDAQQYYQYETNPRSLCVQLAVSAFLTLFSARAGGGFFFSTMPAPALGIAAACSLAISTVIACLWPTGKFQGSELQGLCLGSTYKLWPLWVWIYALVWFVIQDCLKVRLSPFFSSSFSQ